MAKAWQSFRSGIDFPAVSAKAVQQRTKLFLLTFDLAFRCKDSCKLLNQAAIRPTDFAVKLLSRSQHGDAMRCCAAIRRRGVQPAAVARTHHRVGRIHERMAWQRSDDRRLIGGHPISRADVMPDPEPDAGGLRAAPGRDDAGAAANR